MRVPLPFNYIFRLHYLAFLLLIGGNVWAQKVALQPSQIIESNVAFEDWGTDVEGGADFNNDGFIDFVVYNRKLGTHGQLHVFLGKASGYDTVPSSIIAFDANTGYPFDFSVGGDINNDGYDDLAIGLASMGDFGGFMIQYGSAAGIISVPNLLVQGKPGGLNDHLGFALDIKGDIDNDGFDDLIVSDPYIDRGFGLFGRVFIYNGSATGLQTTQRDSLQTIFGDLNFGFNIAYAGDINNDDFDDIMVFIGETNSNLSEWLDVYLGSATGILRPAHYQHFHAWDEGFGWTMGAAGDVNNDGFDDMYVAAYDFDPQVQNQGTGKVKLILGSNAGVDSSIIEYLSPHSGNQFGYKIDKLGDFNGDGYDDLAISTPGYIDPLRSNGIVEVFLGNPTGIDDTGHYFYEGIQTMGGPVSEAAFAGDVNKDGFNDILIGWDDYRNGQFSEGAILICNGETKLQADFEPSSDEICQYDPTVQFIDRSRFGATQWLWNFGDGNTSNLQNPNHTYATPGTYVVTLTSRNTFGHPDIYKDTILVIPTLSSGIYTLGGVNPDFNTFQEFNNVIRCGISGDVTLRVRNGTYQETLDLIGVQSYGGNYTLTIESESGNADSVLITSSTDTTVMAENTNNVILNNIAFDHNGKMGVTIYLSESNDITFRNCRVHHDDNGSPPFTSRGIEAHQSDDIIIESCFFTKYADTSFAGGSFRALLFNDCSECEVKSSNFLVERRQAIDAIKCNKLNVDNNVVKGKGRHNSGIAPSIWLMLIDSTVGFNITNNVMSNGYEAIEISNSQGTPNYNLIANNSIGGYLGYSSSLTNSTYGIELDNCNYFNVYHNSIYYDKPINGYAGGGCLRLWECDSIQIYNNAFKVGNKFSAAYNFYNNTNVKSDFNVFDGKISDVFSTSTKTQQLADWVAQTGNDNNSIADTIIFMDTTDLRVDSRTSILNESGWYLPEVPYDQLGVVRDSPTVDIGAYEFDGDTLAYALNKNIALVEVVNDTIELGLNQIQVKFTNVRQPLVTTTQFSYEIDSGVIVSETWNGNLFYGDTLVFTFNTPYTVTQGFVYDVTVWHQIPNDTDIVALNDTVTKRLSTPLAGTYTLGGVDPDFETFDDLTLIAQEAKVNGNVNILIRPGTYYNPFLWELYSSLYLGPFGITFQPETSNANDVTLIFQLILESANLNFKNLTIVPERSTSTGFYNDKGFEIKGCWSIVFDSCIFKGTADVLQRVGPTVIKSKDVVIKNSIFKNLDLAVHYSGQNYFSGSHVTGEFYFENNYIDSCLRGLSFQGRMDTIYISHNTSTLSVDKPIEAGVSNQVYSMNYALLSNNHFESGPVRFFDNGQFSHIRAFNNFFPGGLVIWEADKVEVVSNNLFIANIQQNDSVFVCNNNIGAYRVGTAGQASYYLKNNNYVESTHNNLYSTPPVDLMYDGNSFYNNLPDIQINTGLEANSLSTDPLYIDSTDYHVNNVLLSKKGKPIPFVNIDFDGEVRDPLTPDIGADEFSNSNLPALADFSLECSGNNSLSFINSSIRATAYLWDFGDGNTSTQTDPNHSYGNAGQYQVTLISYSALGNDTIAKQVEAGPAFAVNAGANQLICEGSSVQIGSTSQAGVSYTWQPALGLSSVFIANPVATPQQPTTYTVVAENQTGCLAYDTIVVDLIPLLPTVSITAEICQGDSYEGYTQTGVYTNKFPGSNGCDSTRILNLIAKPALNHNLSQVICDGESFEGYTSTGTYTNVFTGSNGCDSTRVLQLTVQSDIYTNATASIVQGDSILLAGTYQTTAGIYIDSLLTTNGCDSIVTTTLTVTVGIQPLNEALAFKLYPNPATNQITIEWQGNYRGENLELNIYNSLGQGWSFYTGNANTPTQKRMHFSLTELHLKPGIYYVEVLAGNARAMQKLILLPGN